MRGCERWPGVLRGCGLMSRRIRRLAGLSSFFVFFSGRGVLRLPGGVGTGRLLAGVRGRLGRSGPFVFSGEQGTPCGLHRGFRFYWVFRMASCHRLSTCWYFLWFPGWRGVSWCSHLQMVLAVTPSSAATVAQLIPIFLRRSARSCGGGSTVSGVSSIWGYLTFRARGYGSVRVIFPLVGSMLSRGA